MALFSDAGVELLLRWLHFLAGITWIGLLYYFNFVQGPFCAEADGATKSAATQKLGPRALWWFRWGALFTFLSGAAIITKRVLQAPPGTSVMTSPWGEAIFTGALFGTLMFVNVWAVIWPKQQVVIASAVAAAGAAKPTRGRPRRGGGRSWRRAPTSCSPCRCSSSWGRPRICRRARSRIPTATWWACWSWPALAGSKPPPCATRSPPKPLRKDRNGES